MSPRWRLALIIMGLLVACSGYAELNPRSIAVNCLNCHADTSGLIDSPLPALSGFSRQQLEQALLNFKYDKQSGTLMPRLAKGYSDEQLQAVADYLSRR